MSTSVGVAGVPWNQKIDSKDAFSTGNYYIGNHYLASFTGGELHNASKNYTFESPNGKNHTIYCSAGNYDGSKGGEGKKVWLNDGLKTSMVNGKNHNSAIYVGAEVTKSSFFTSLKNYYYQSSTPISRCTDVLGFGCYTSCSGSFSDGGGKAQAYCQNVYFFMADPNTYLRHIFKASDTKLAGDYSLGNLHSSNGTYWCSYRMSDADISYSKTRNLVLVGLGFQYYHGTKTGSHTTACKLSKMRLMVGHDSSTLVSKSSVEEYLITGPDDATTLGNFNKEFRVDCPV